MAPSHLGRDALCHPNLAHLMNPLLLPIWIKKKTLREQEKEATHPTLLPPSRACRSHRARVRGAESTNSAATHPAGRGHHTYIHVQPPIAALSYRSTALTPF